MPAPVVSPCHPASCKDDHAGGQEGNARGHSFDDAQRIDAHLLVIGKTRHVHGLDRDNGEKGRGKADQDMGAEARGPGVCLPLEADQPAEDDGAEQAGKDDGIVDTRLRYDVGDDEIHGFSPRSIRNFSLANV